MAFIPVPNGALAELVYIWDDQVVENTLWFRGIGNYDSTALGGLVDGLIGWWTDQMRPLQSQNIKLSFVRATAMHSNTAPSIEIPILTDDTGSNLSIAVSNNTTFVITFKTEERGRSFRGRNYILGIPYSETDLNSVVGTYATALLNAYNQLLTVTYMGANVLSVCSKFSGGAARSEGVLTDVVSFGYADLYLDSQRRRLPGRGA